MDLNRIASSHRIDKVRFFLGSHGSTMVALYGQPSNYVDGWIDNLNIEKVFANPPKEYAFDRLYSVSEILIDAKLSKSFSSSSALPAFAVSDQRVIVYTEEVGEQIDQSSQPLAFFPYMPKSGGDILLNEFVRVFSRKQCLKIWDPRFGADVSPGLYSRISKQRFSSISAVIGHLTMAQFDENQYCHSLLQEGKARVFATVRNPVERIIDLYHYIKISPLHPSHAKTMNKSLGEFALHEQANCQYNYLALHPLESIDSILSRIEVYPTEKSRRGLELFLQRHYNIQLTGLETNNVTQAPDKTESFNPSSIDDIDQDTIRRLEEIHHLDIELYNASLRLAHDL